MGKDKQKYVTKRPRARSRTRRPDRKTANTRTNPTQLTLALPPSPRLKRAANGAP